jgi:pyruvate carboxylase
MKIDLEKLNQLSNYWEDVREWYYPFESELKAGTAEVFDHEIPGGQYSNLRPQARSLGLEEKFEQIKRNYVTVNKMFGDIVKVTPSSKVVGDMALFMTANNYSEDDIYSRGDQLSFPDSVIGLMKGDLGQTAGGFPEQLQKIVLKNEVPFLDRPNAHLQPIDFDEAWKLFRQKFGSTYKHRPSSYLFYPKVFEEYHGISSLGMFTTRLLLYFYGLKINEETPIIGPRQRSCEIHT